MKDYSVVNLSETEVSIVLEPYQMCDTWTVVFRVTGDRMKYRAHLQTSKKNGLPVPLLMSKEDVDFACRAEVLRQWYDNYIQTKG